MLFSHRHVYKICQRNLFFSEVPKVDLTRFGNKLFNYSQHFMQIETSKLTYILVDAPFNGEGINV